MDVFKYLRRNKEFLVDDNLSLNEFKNRLIEWSDHSEIKPKYRRAIIQRISRINSIPSGADFERLATELAELRSGIIVTEEEALMIMKLCKKVEMAEKSSDKITYDKAVEELENYKQKVIDEEV